MLWPGVNRPFYVWDLLCKPYWGLSLARPKKHLIDGVPTFSAHWWSRLGGFLLRLAHRLLFLPHIGLLYVDDFVFVQEAKVLPLSAAFLVLFFRAINLPISWKKCEISHTITWIGWKFNFYSGLVSIHPDKQKKLMELITS